ncbi:MAG TPA: hypothetical protein VD886_13740 [Herpetosiphonaceae bacterium]|nr:hypothetical protein [Herpetosiphonaceae bacterium]
MYRVPPAHRPPERDPRESWIVGILFSLLGVVLLCLCAGLALYVFGDMGR